MIEPGSAPPAMAAMIISVGSINPASATASTIA
ncbi:Uncharacterised protein [Vibrio cholerae]|nr:Uncharacterised protein [Vibrio cholerae]